MTAIAAPGRSPGIACLGRTARTTSTAALAGIGALHALWGTGSHWPMASRADLSDAVLGAPGLDRDDDRTAAACFAVAGMLAAAATLVSGWPRRPERIRTAAVAGAAAVLAGRGALGLAGRTHLVVPVSTGERFRRLDRRVYAPLCLTLAGLIAVSEWCSPPACGSCSTWSSAEEIRSSRKTLPRNVIAMYAPRSDAAARVGSRSRVRVSRRGRPNLTLPHVAAEPGEGWLRTAVLTPAAGNRPACRRMPSVTRIP